MTTAKTPRTKPGSERAGSPLSHVDGCSGERIETFTTSDPKGETVTVTRCLDCPAAVYERE